MATRDEDFGRAVQSIDDIKNNTACLPALCEMVARHDEKLKSLDTLVGRVWKLSIAAFTILGGLLVKLVFGKT